MRTEATDITGSVADTSAELLTASNIDVFYNSLQALWSVSFHLHRGETVCLLGVNGSGKSSCLKAVMGIVRAVGGHVIFDGQRIDRLATERLAELGLVLVPERHRVFPKLTVHENLFVGATPRRARPAMRQTMEHVFELFPRLYERRQQLAGSMSGGEQQMLAIGRGLMACPKLLLLDEPYLGLAPRARDEVAQVLTQLRASGLSILFIEQSVVDSVAISDRAYVLDAGRIVWQGPAEQLLSDDATTQAYFGFRKG
ncbi:MAG: ABC transporter ATP-binding protein [Dehalococcoidia bacterium]